MAGGRGGPLQPDGGVTGGSGGGVISAILRQGQRAFREAGKEASPGSSRPCAPVPCWGCEGHAWGWSSPSPAESRRTAWAGWSSWSGSRRRDHRCRPPGTQSPQPGWPCSPSPPGSSCREPRQHNGWLAQDTTAAAVPEAPLRLLSN